MGIAGYRFQTIIADVSPLSSADDEVCTFAGSDTIAGGAWRETVYERVQRETSSIRKINARDLKHGNIRAKFQGSFNGPR